MISIVGLALQISWKLSGDFSDQSGKLDVAWERKDVESLAGMFKPLCPIQNTPVVANGVPAEWIDPQGGLKTAARSSSAWGIVQLRFDHEPPHPGWQRRLREQGAGAADRLPPRPRASLPGCY